MSQYILVTAILGLLLFKFCGLNNKRKQQTIKQYNLQQYTGTWYEIARFNHSMEKDLTHVTATYSLKSDGTISVTNKGYLNNKNGKEKSVTGYATMPDTSNMGYLKVYFSKWFGAPYLILDLDTVNYQYALIGSTFNQFLWILSRTPNMPKQHYQQCIQTAKNLGYDTNKLLMVAHNAGTGN